MLSPTDAFIFNFFDFSFYNMATIIGMLKGELAGTVSPQLVPFLLNYWNKMLGIFKLIIHIIFIIILFTVFCLCFNDPAEAMEPAFQSKSELEESIASTKSHLEYWKSQFRECERIFKEHIMSNNMDGQKEALEAM